MTKKDRMTKITILLTFLFIISRSFDTITALINRIYFLKKDLYSPIILSSANLIRQIVLFYYFGLHSLNGIIYVLMDKNLNRLNKKILAKTKVSF